MEKEEFLEPEENPLIDEPHFEEAWTVLAARPVEPLKELDPKHRVRRAAKLIAAFVGAGLLGVFVALASVRFRQGPGSVSEVHGPVQSNLTDTAADGAAPTESTAITPEVEAAPMKTLTRLTEAPKRQIAQSTASFQKDPAADSSSSHPRLANEWEERRPRRIRRHRSEIDRNLLRIQEIFEGRRP